MNPQPKPESTKEVEVNPAPQTSPVPKLVKPVVEFNQDRVELYVGETICW